MKVALLILLLSFPALSDLPASFSDGLKSYQNEEYEQAAEQFLLSLEESPNNSTVLYNLGLTEFKRGRVGAALAHLRKALYLSPSYAPAKEALQFIQKDSQPDATINYLNKAMSLPADLIIGAFTVFLGLFLWFLISFLAERKNALLNSEKLPKTPWKTVFLFFFVIALGALLGLRANERLKTKATVVQTNVQAYSGPSVNQAVLFDINEGIEVVIRQRHEGWLQVTTSSGRTGWIPKDSTIISWGEDS